MLKSRAFKNFLGFIIITAGFISGSAETPAFQQSDPMIIDAAVNNIERTAEDFELDEARKPAVIMSYMGIKVGDHVADLGTGTGYYAELLARAVGKSGKVYAVNNAFVVSQIGNDVIESKASHPDLTHITASQQELDALKFDTPLDAVFLMLFYHDIIWQDTDRAKMNKAIFDALKPGGIYAITDHRAEAGSGERDASTLHRTDEAMVRAEAEAAGFVLVGQSNALTTSGDRNNVSVFAPSIRGKTSRFVYKFQKPKAD